MKKEVVAMLLAGGQGHGDAKPIKTEKVPCHDQAQSLVIDLPPMSVVMYRCTRKNPVRKPKPKLEKLEGEPEKKAPAKPRKKAAPKAKKADAEEPVKHVSLTKKGETALVKKEKAAVPAKKEKAGPLTKKEKAGPLVKKSEKKD